MSLHIKYVEDDTFNCMSPTSPALNVTLENLETIIKYSRNAFQELCSVDINPLLRKLLRLYNGYYLGLPFETYSNLTECKTDYCPLNRIQYPERRQKCEDFILDRIQSSSPVHVLSVYPGGLFSEMILALRIMRKMFADGKNRLFHFYLYMPASYPNASRTDKMTQFVALMASASFLFDVDMKIECLHDTKTLNTKTLIFATDPGLEYFEIKNAANELLQMIKQVGKDQTVFAADTATLSSDEDIKDFHQSLRDAELQNEEIHRQSGIMALMSLDSNNEWYDILRFWDKKLERWIEFCPTKQKMFYTIDGNTVYILNHDYEPCLYKAEEKNEQLLNMQLVHRKNVESLEKVM